MMKTVRKQHTTRVLYAPRDWDESQYGNCKPLYVSDHEGVMFSYWKPSLKDRLRLLFGRTIRLATIGESHPPVCIDTVKD